MSSFFCRSANSFGDFECWLFLIGRPFKFRNIQSSPMNQANDIASIANNIRETDIKLIFKKLTKHNNSVIKSALSDLIQKLTDVDFDTTFCEIVGHCCVVLEQFLYEDDPEIRTLSLKMISQVIIRLKRDIVGYATLIFPILLIYCNDSEVSKDALNVLNINFPTTEKKVSLFNKMQYDICEKISSTFRSMKTLLFTKESIGRVSAACLALTIQIIKTVGKTDFVNELISTINISDMLQISNNAFLPSTTPELRKASYEYLNFVEIEDYNAILAYFECDDSILSQESLINLTISLINNEKIEKSAVQASISHSLNNFSNPPVNFFHLLQLICDDNFLCELIQKVESQELFDILFSRLQNQELIIPLFEKMISNDETNPAFYKTCPLSIFSFAKDNEIIHRALLSETSNESRCIEFILPFYSEEKVIEWLRSRDKVSTKCCLEICEKFSSSVLSTIWPHYETIPFSDNEYFIDVMCYFLTKDQIPNFIKLNENSIPQLFKKWKRDFQILKCRQLTERIEKYLEEDPSLIQYISKIYPDDPQLTEIITSIIFHNIQSGHQTDSAVFEYFTPSIEFLKSFLFSSSSLSSITPTHVLNNSLIEAIPHFIESMDSNTLVPHVISFVTNAKIDPLDIKYDYVKYPLFTCKYFDHFGYKLLNPETVCLFLNSYLNEKVPWLPVFLYIKEVNWQIISDKIWTFVTDRVDLANICHSLNLYLALSCICASSDSTSILDNLPHDYLTLTALPNAEPPVDMVHNIETDVLRMEWLQKKPKPPDFNEKDTSKYEICLRQSIVYLRFYLPTLMVFDPVYNFVLRALDHCDNRISFFYCARIIAMIIKCVNTDNSTTIPAAPFLQKLIEYTSKFAPFTTSIENELFICFSVAKKLTKDEFDEIAVSSAHLYTTSLSSQLIRMILPLFEYFSSWDLFDNNLNSQLDLNNEQSWNFLTSALLAMPSSIRVKYVTKYSKRIPSIVNQMSPKSRQFEQIVIAFPVTFSKWINELKDIAESGQAENPKNKEKVSLFKQIQQEIKARISRNVFKSIVKEIISLKLENSTVHSNVSALSLGVIYKEDEMALPIAVELRFPETFPIDDVRISSDLGDTTLNAACDQRIWDSIDISESIVSGIKTWHKFVIQRVKDADPCPICYSYFSSDGRQTPSVKCGVCGQTFHRSCLRKWSEKCLYRTCPACSSPWKEANK